MSFSISSPVTGAAVTGLTSPTYTYAAGTGPTNRSKQYTVSNLGGTQTGVSVHSVSNPFTCMFGAPATVRSLPRANPITGLISQIPVNVYKLNVRKGLVVQVNQPVVVGGVYATINVPAGAETNDKVSLAAMFSSFIGVFTQTVNGILDTVVSGEP